jgi:hypothetical protein
MIQPSDYAMKIYNQFREEREEGVVIFSYLVGDPAFYMPNEKYHYRSLGLFCVKRVVRGLRYVLN